MSPKAVYYTHSFEMRSFPLENNLPEDEEQLKAGVKPDFQGEVIDLLQKGRKDPLAGGITNAQQPLASYVNKFKGIKGLQAFLVVGKWSVETVSTTLRGKELYGKSSQMIQATVKELIGFEPKIVTYDVTGYASSAGGSEHGSQDKRNSVTIKERSGRGSQDGSGMSDATDEFYINNAEGYVLYEYDPLEYRLIVERTVVATGTADPDK
ncbi:hypothetical protein M430DRAFT_42236 [Amorphotheca resinae ATCC 22711]|uniref:Uncharacterized protein n=1 Tax=Amorphotheca resinae ATCC 22711 TaxID=857342 RepID=A0A2T3B1Y5_AMORE|nr:hypothetical protein M430DRAFT_42236 [Amorphotheca resinae ATCC 22711]PSS18570.1 hypothetical protein M430DRAFT_42236 [Amorphotheca resinae ATCC 22711]